MRNVILTSLAVLGLLAASSCSDNDTFDPNKPVIDPVGSGERITYTAPRDTAFWHVDDFAGRQILGAGYDPNAAYMSAASVKAPVYDLEKIRAYDENRVVTIRSRESGYNFVSGPDAASLLMNFAEKTQVLGDGETAPLCAGTYLDEEAFQRDIDHSSMFSFAYNDTYYEFYNLRVNVMKSEVKRHPEEFLCDAFIADLAQLSAEDLIAKYGTHVLIDVNTGMSIRSVSRTAALEQLGTSPDGFKRDVADYYARWARWKLHIPSSIQTSTNLYEGRYCGGTTSVTFAGGDVSPLSSVQADTFKAWLGKGCTVDNAALLKIAQAPVPLYELIADETKANALKEATHKHLAQNKLTSIDTKLLVQTWKGGFYHYATTYDTTCDGGVCGIFANQQSGMIPLYANATNYGCYVFTEATNLHKELLTDKNTEILGYIYATQQPGTVPLYAATPDDFVNTYCTLTDSASYGERGTWKKAGILGYVIPPTVQ